jgi:DUF2934 family protein
MHREHRSIGELAYRLWQARGCPEGSAERDWLDAENQLRSAQRAAELRTVEAQAVESQAVESRAVESQPTGAWASELKASNATDRSLQETFPASDPPASQRKDEPPANADAKWKAAGVARTTATVRSRRAKSAPGKPNAEPPT